MMRIVFVGESWLGSSARSLREALGAQDEIAVDEIDEDHFLPRFCHVQLRFANRLVAPWQRAELKDAIRQVVHRVRPGVVLLYKCAGISAEFIVEMRSLGCPVVNVFPDCSPHAHGRTLRKALGQYDLVISTKPFHPPLWQTVYGYRNKCVCVPHGYDPRVHLWSEPAVRQEHDLLLCGAWRPEYHRLMRSLADLPSIQQLSVAIGGPGWERFRTRFPRQWRFLPAPTGRAYGEFLRSAKVVIAPVNGEVVIHGLRQPGDQDTTRTYELAAAYCFFLHQRTDFVRTVYDEQTEVPLWRDARELADLVQRWLPDAAGRRSCSAKAHRRAVPAYSIPARATEIRAHLEALVSSRTRPGVCPVDADLDRMKAMGTC